MTFSTHPFSSLFRQGGGGGGLNPFARKNGSLYAKTSFRLTQGVVFTIVCVSTCPGDPSVRQKQTKIIMEDDTRRRKRQQQDNRESYGDNDNTKRDDNYTNLYPERTDGGVDAEHEASLDLTLDNEGSTEATIEPGATLENEGSPDSTSEYFSSPGPTILEHLDSPDSTTSETIESSGSGSDKDDDNEDGSIFLRKYK